MAGAGWHGAAGARRSRRADLRRRAAPAVAPLSRRPAPGRRHAAAAWLTRRSPDGRPRHRCAVASRQRLRRLPAR
ncbi:MAG: hypothetical protein MZW92_21385 [Comamonadaceae bacterium]|nr:hypothetical protein [Comamonadaceae bacterium]